MLGESSRLNNSRTMIDEKGNKLTFDIHYNIRLVEASEYDIADYTALKGFISGMYAGNYDITHIFIDSLCKIVPSDCGPEVDKFLSWLDGFSEKNNIKFTVTISGDPLLRHGGYAEIPVNKRK